MKKTKKFFHELNFDKTRDLGGYAIRTTVKDMEGWFHLDLQKTGLNSFGGFVGTIGKMIFEAVNATTTMRISDRKAPLRLTIDEKKNYGQLLEVIDGKSDIILLPRNQLLVSNLATTVAIIQSNKTFN